MKTAIPAVEQPGPVETAAAQLADAEQRAEAARQRLREAEAGRREATALDKADLSRRIAAGDENPKPSRKHRAKAEQAHEEVREVVEAAEANVTAAREALDRATTQHADKWAEHVATARDKLDAEYIKLLDKLAGMDRRRGELRTAARWLVARRTPGQNAKLAPVPGYLSARDARHANSKMASLDAIALLREYVETTGVEGERSQAEERAERRRQAEERREAARAFEQSGLQAR